MRTYLIISGFIALFIFTGAACPPQQQTTNVETSGVDDQAQDTERGDTPPETTDPEAPRDLGTMEPPSQNERSDPQPPPVQEPEFTGEVLAGDSSPFIVFNQEDFEAALESDRLIVLYYYANWCPICRAEVPRLEAAFDQLETDEVVGFRVNYNDNDTDQAEVDLAREHNVLYQHTKVFLQDGQRVLKSPETWATDRYLSEINRFLAN